MKQDNRGFSLVELIVVIGIMAVMIGVVSLSAGMLTGTKAKECAQKVSMQLNSTKTGSMSRYDETMKLYGTTDGIYTENKSYTIKQDATKKEITGSEKLKMGDEKVKVTVYLSDSSAVVINETNSVTISYNHATGAQDAVVVGATERPDVYVDKITFAYGARTYTIDMVPKTGKHTLNAS